MNVTLIDHMGDDRSVVNAARVSFHKEITGPIRPQDVRLLKYLAKHNHWSPFAHTCLQLRIRAPIFVARQLAKHQVGLSWNEVSRRYVDEEPSFYVPESWRLRASDKKQGSSNDYVSYDIFQSLDNATTEYRNMINAGIAPEMARMILPQNMFTEWIWTGSVYAFARVCILRLKDDTQQETRMVATQIERILRDLFPECATALLG